MAIENTLQSLGAEAARKVEAQLANLGLLRQRIRRVRTDNRLHVWEWLSSADGFLKTDAVDHCEAHDLVGCQDIAWDVAGGIVEHDLTGNELQRLNRHMGAAGVSADAELVRAMVRCYLAFQLGLWSTASGSDGQMQAERYARKLSYLLKQ